MGPLLFVFFLVYIQKTLYIRASKQTDMDNVTITSVTPGTILTGVVVRGDNDTSLNGLTSIFDMLDVIFVGSKFEQDKSPAQAIVNRLIKERGNADFLVAQDRGQYGPSITPALHFVGLQKGASVYGGNSIVICGHEHIVHDRVEPWDMYYRLSR